MEWDWYGKDIDWYYRHALVISIWGFGFIHLSNIWAKSRRVLGSIDWFARPAHSHFTHLMSDIIVFVM